jgi:hypothetical protein
MLGKYIDKVEHRDNMQSCTRICVEVDLEKGLPQDMKLTLDNYMYLYSINYEQLPFK